VTTTTTDDHDHDLPPTTTTTTKPSAATTTTKAVRLMKAVVLVGGEGTRLRPLTLSTPKQMLPIVGVPMIERVLAHLAVARSGRGDLVAGLPARRVQGGVSRRPCRRDRLTYAVEPEPLDTAGAVRFAATYGGVDDTFVVVNGDVLTDLDLGSLIAFHRQSGAEGTIALHPVPDPSAFGVVPTDDDGRVTAFVEKPPTRRGPDQRDQRGHLRPRGFGAGSDPPDRTRLDRTRDVSGHGAQRRALRPGGRRLLARHRHAGGLPAGQP
jgi:hypothetical protein